MRDPVEKAVKHHAYLWNAYAQVVDNSPVENHPIALIARARNEDEAQAIVAALRKVRYEVIEVAKKWWPPARRWRIIALTESMPITRQSTEEWVRSTATLLSQYNGALEHWAPAEKPAA